MKRICGVGIFMMLAIAVVGQNSSPIKAVLTFEDAIKIAMQNGVLLNTQRNNLQLSQMQRTASIAGVAPNINLNSQFVRIDGNSFNPNTGRAVNGIRDNVTGSINANLNLFSGFNRINQIRQYANQLEAQSYFVNRTSQDLINTVANQYLTVMLDVELYRIAKENFDALTTQLNQVKEQVKLGARGIVDQYNQDALTKTAELSFVQAEILLNNDKALLSQTLLLDPLDEFDVEQPKWDINEIGSAELNVQELADKAKQYRGDYLRATKLESAQHFAMNATRGTMMPTLIAFGSVGSAYNFQHGVSPYLMDSAGNQIDNPLYPRPFDEQFRTNNVYKQYGLQLQIPVFNGLQNRTNYMQQKVLYENSQLTRKNVEFQIRNDVVRSVRNYEGAKKAFGVTNDKLSSAEYAFQLESERYNLGITNFVDFVNANRVLVQAKTDKAQAEYRLVFQRILLEYAVGTLKSEDLIKH